MQAETQSGKSAVQHAFHSQWRKCRKMVEIPTSELFYCFVLQKLQGIPAELRNIQCMYVYNAL